MTASAIGFDQPPSGRNVDPGDAAPGTRTVIVVEDDPDILFALSMLLEGWGLRAIQARSFQDLSNQLGSISGSVHLIITDYYLPAGATGRDVVEAVQRSCGGRPVPAIVLTGDTAAERAQEARAHGYRLLLKPVQPEDLLSAIQELLG